MIITCLNCSTNFDILPIVLGAGKKTRCFNCGYSWFQEPVVANVPPPVTYAAIREMAHEQETYQQAAYAQQLAQPAASATKAKAPVMTAPPPTPQPLEIPKPEAIPEPETEAKIEVEVEAEDTEVDLDDVRVSPSDKDDKSEISKADLDAMFGEDSDMEPIASMVGGGGGDAAGPVSIDDIDDPDPIPQFHSPSGSGDDVPVKKRSVIKLIGIGIGILLIAALGGGFFAREMIINMVPATKDIYKIIGLVEKLGAGLAIQDTKPVPGTQEGKPILTVKGVIANVSDKERPVPMIKVILKDAKEQAVQTTVVAPLRNRLQAQKKMRFDITISEPSPLARKIEVEFAEPEAEAAKGHEATKKKE